jgi:uncharacterized repeat protein (TIGR01451 family)
MPLKEIAMSISKMWFTKLLLSVLAATTVLLAGCGGSGGSQTASQGNEGNAASATAAPTLGTEQSFAVLGGQTVTNTGPSVVTGNLGVSPGTAVTGFPPGIVIGGVTHAADAVALQAQNDTTILYDKLASQACTSDLTGQDLGGMTLVPGVYCFTSSAQLTGTLTLNAGGDPSAVWVFQTVSTLVTASSSSVQITNGGQPCNVFWKVGSSATLGTNTTFVGTIVALTSIALQTGAKVSGRALARNGEVTMDSNTVAAAVCGVPPVTPIPPTLGKSFSPATINAGGVSTLTITLINVNATQASLTAQFIDFLPSGLLLIGSSVSSTCIETPPALAPLAAGIKPAWFVIGPDAVGLMEGAIPANGSCTVTAQVSAAVAGTYVNTLPAGVLQTSNGNNTAPAVATLTVMK